MLTLFSFMRLLLSFAGVLRSSFKTFGTSVATSPSLGKTLLSSFKTLLTPFNKKMDHLTSKAIRFRNIRSLLTFIFHDD